MKSIAIVLLGAVCFVGFGEASFAQEKAKVGAAASKQTEKQDAQVKKKSPPVKRSAGGWYVSGHMKDGKTVDHGPISRLEARKLATSLKKAGYKIVGPKFSRNGNPLKKDASASKKSGPVIPK